MFKELKSEAILTFDLKTTSPLYIKSGSENSLNPSAADGRYMEVYRNGVLEPFIPGTSLKGAFRSRAERILQDKEACYIISKDPCINDKNYRFKTGRDRYKDSCPVCRLFGSMALRSRINFSDAYVSGEYKTGERTCVGIDRITGAAKGGALYNMEYIDEAVFKERITLQNFEPYQIKLLLLLLQEMNTGFLTIGGMTSKGFGCLKVEDLNLKVRYYKRDNKNLKGYDFKDYFYEKEVEGYENIYNLVEKVNLNTLKRGGIIDEQTI